MALAEPYDYTYF